MDECLGNNLIEYLKKLNFTIFSVNEFKKFQAVLSRVLALTSEPARIPFSWWVPCKRIPVGFFRSKLANLFVLFVLFSEDPDRKPTGNHLEGERGFG